MKLTPKTIQIFLPGGDPQGIRMAEITTRIMQAIEVPRSLLADFLKMPEAQQVALYFLIGSAEDVVDPQVYIGQTGDLVTRMANHNKNKEFWERAVVVTSKTNNMTQTHALFLEWYCLQAVRKAGRYADQNGNNGSRPHTPAPMEADCLEMFETASTLLATLGHPVFVSVTRTPVIGGDNDLFFCTGSDADGKGLYTPEGFVVLAGSSGRLQTAQSLADHSYENLRRELIEAGVCAVQGDRFVFLKDHLFNRPSRASVALQGRAGNGWNEWKDKDGRTLNEMKRTINETRSE